MVSRLTRALVPFGSGLVALVLSHSIVYLVRYGSKFGEALAHEGHGTAWTLAVWSSAVLGGALALAGLVRLLSLARSLPSTESPASAGGAAWEPWVRGWVGTSIRLSGCTALLLTIQENAEHLAAGLPLPGILLLLRPEYPFALVIVIAASFAVGFVVHLYRRRRDELLARIRRPSAAFRPARPLRRHVRTMLRPPASILGRIGGLRAPPVRFAS